MQRRSLNATNSVRAFGDTAKSLAKTPLGITALFIVLIYGVAALVLGLSGANLTAEQRLPLVWFLVTFPVLVLIVFAWLVAKHHTKLYGPSDFRDQKLFLDLQLQLESTQRRVDVLSELTPEVALPPLSTQTELQAQLSMPATSLRNSDPQSGRWGGKRESDHRLISVGQIRPLRADPDNYRIPLQVRSTDPQRHPLQGKVRFHLHSSFSPQLQEVVVRDGIARLVLIGFGAFTVGAETDDGTRLELNLADPDIDAAQAFKDG